mgnify:CR=1 FL=1
MTRGLHSKISKKSNLTDRLKLYHILTYSWFNNDIEKIAFILR